ncbi:uncharacterized protein LY89DRAFT_735624 [Mollisia scopiformis]|uniref:Uncharacterized protein n=1 Tax=Mollisia scopiformis TaxID=149040 RepID=A0A194X5R5_MOLSC|nr:uncharacterized protein LY89DRAFT_735624 [Mollisia scopiformis]KUJ15523.1 hypothetical protein LY89DRAFT_735624 [Mollisia scopiformis]
MSTTGGFWMVDTGGIALKYLAYELGLPHQDIWRSGLTMEIRMPVWTLYVILAANILLRGTKEVDLLTRYISNIQCIVMDMCTWFLTEDRGLTPPKDLDFVLGCPPEPERYCVYLNVLHDLVSQIEAKIFKVDKKDRVKLSLESFNGACIEAGKLCVKNQYPVNYYLDYEREFPGFRKNFKQVANMKELPGIRDTKSSNPESDNADEELFDVDEEGETELENMRYSTAGAV